ncbi:MAG: B12-binding domain-containing radical SAM protein, partial [Nitrospinaceae bacterium]
MKVLLLRPAAEKKSMARCLPLGLLAIGSVLQRAGHQVRILDLRISPDSDRDLETALSTFAPDVVGIGVMTIESRYGFIDAKRVKALAPGLPVVLGGPHCKHDPKYILNHRAIDIMVIGEGDLTMVDLMDALESGQPLDTVAGIAFRRDGEFVTTAPRPIIRNLDDFPQEYDLIRLQDYFNFKCSMDFFPVYRSSQFIPLVTSRGCPFKCTYCHDIFSKSIQYRSPDVVVDEMELLVRTYAIEEFHIVDDTFNLNMQRAKRILDLIVERGLKVHISFPNGLRADFFDDELIAKMARAGVYRLALGIESGSQRIQDLIKKDLDISILPAVVAKLTHAKISVHGFFMLGFPSETRQEMEQTIAFACNLGLTTANFSLVIPNPGTELRETFLEEMEQADPGFSDYSFDAAQCNASRVSDETLLLLKREANRRFYFTRKRLRHVFGAMEP